MSWDEQIASWENDRYYVESMKVIPELNDFRLAIGLVEPKSKILSCGCGSGREVFFLVNQLRCKVVAIDCSKKILDLSKSIEPKAEYILGDFMNYQGQGFDYVLCLNRTINHISSLEKRKEFIKNSYNYLNKHGRLIISTSHRYSSLRKFYTFLKYLFKGLKNYYPPQK